MLAMRVTIPSSCSFCFQRESQKLSEEDKNRVQLEDQKPFLTRTIVTIPENYLEMTANLIAPLVINKEKGIAKLFVLTSMDYDTRHYLLPEEMRNTPASTH